MKQKRPLRIYLLTLGLLLMALLNGWRGWQFWLIETNLPSYQFHLTTFIIFSFLWSGLFITGAALVFWQYARQLIFLICLYSSYGLFALFLYQKNQSPLAPYNWGMSTLFYLLILLFTLWHFKEQITNKY